MSGPTPPKRPRRLRTGLKRTKPRAAHDHQSAGTKLCRQFMKKRTGIKAETGAEARKWYRTVNL